MSVNYLQLHWDMLIFYLMHIFEIFLKQGKPLEHDGLDGMLCVGFNNMLSKYVSEQIIYAQ